MKDRRPTISPNFNFLGQLLDYEKKLRDSGHMTKPRIGPLPDDASHSLLGSREQSESKDQTLVPPRIEMNHNVQKATMVKPCIVTPGAVQNICTPTSAFCRRRNVPSLTKLSFAQKPLNFATSSVYGLEVPACGAGVVLDLNAPSSYSRDLEKSEGNESQVDCYNADKPFEVVEQHPTRLDHNLPMVRSPLNDNSNEQTEFDRDISDSSRHVSVLGKIDDVEMIDADQHTTCLDTSPPSPTFSSSLLTSGTVFRPIRSPIPSAKPDRLLSRKTRSPKIVRKSWRPPYDYLASRIKQSNFSCQAPIPFRSRTFDRISEKAELTLPPSSLVQCESPSTVGISSLTLNSPRVNPGQNDPLEVVGKSYLRLPIASQSSLAPRSGYSNVLTTNDRCASGSNSLTSNTGSRDAFHLIPGSELKPKWRKRLTKTSGSETPGESTSTSSNFLSHRSIAIST